MPVDPENDPTLISMDEFFWQDFMPLFAMMQARVMADQFILMEIVRDVARQQPDPKRYIAELYDRVISRAEQKPIGKQGKFDANFREAVHAVLLKAGNSL